VRRVATSFLIGMAYRRPSGGGLCLAVSEREVLGFRSGKPHVGKPHHPELYTQLTHLTVGALLDSWGVSQAALDTVVSPLLMRGFIRGAPAQGHGACDKEMSHAPQPMRGSRAPNTEEAGD